MQILGIIGADGKAMNNVSVTMFSSPEDMVEIAERVGKHEKAHLERKGTPFNPVRAEWDAEFDIHRQRLASGRAEGTRFFPLEDRELANNMTIHDRMKLRKIAA